MKLQYCTYIQAKKLKKSGFDWYTESSFVGDEFVSYMGWKNSWKLDDPKHKFPRDKGTGRLASDVRPMISCPYVVLALKWLQQEHDIYFQITYTCSFMDTVAAYFQANTVTPGNSKGLLIDPNGKTGSEVFWGKTFSAPEVESGALDWGLNYITKSNI